MKRAYLDLALRFRADRLGCDTPAAREQAEFRSREIDEAWAVLRNPAARARYDDQLRSAAPRGEATVATQARPGLRPGGLLPLRQADLDLDAQAATLEPASAVDAAPAPRLVRWAPLVVGAVALVFVLGWAGSAARKDPPTLKIKTVEQFGEGTCADPAEPTAPPGPTAGAGQPSLVAVACTDPHTYTVVSRTDATSCPGSRQLARFVGRDKPFACVVESVRR